ncbi:MAG: glycosyltransferase 87 family protein [Terriglobales bacterium]
MYAALLALHAPLLRLPYYWDEAGYYVFAALDCFRHFWLIPRSTLANGHPPLLSLYLAGVWSLGGFHLWVTRSAMLAWAAALVCGVWALAQPRLGRAAAAPALLVALSPLVFAQASLAQLDLPVAALVIWALAARQWQRGWWEAGLLTAACLMKETAVIVPAVLLLADLARGRGRAAARQIAPMAVLAAWFFFYHAHSGYWFGNPQYFAYNLGDTAGSLPRIGLSLLRRVWQLACYDGTGLLTLLAVLAWWRTRRSRVGERWPSAWLLVIGAYLVFHALVGGAVLARYLLPALALYYIGISEWLLRLPRARLWIGVCAAFLVVSWFWNPPYPFPYEDNLAYAQFIRLHQAAAHELEQHPPHGPIYTAWPATDELTRPALGYVTHALAVHALRDFSAASLRGLKPAPGSVLYLYSRTYRPTLDFASAPFWARWARRYFDFAGPAPARLWVARLGLKAFYRRRQDGQWVLLARASPTQAQQRLGALPRPCPRSPPTVAAAPSPASCRFQPGAAVRVAVARARPAAAPSESAKL